MKKPILLFLGVCFWSLINGQAPNVVLRDSKVQDKSLSGKSIKILGSDDKGYYALRVKGINQNPSKLSIDYYKGMEFKSSFDSEEIYVLAARPDGPNRFFERKHLKSYEFSLTDTSGNLHVFYSILDKKNNKNILYASVLNKSSMELEESRKIATITLKFNKNDRRGSFGFIKSVNASKIAIVSLVGSEEQDKEKIKSSVVVMDSSLKILWKRNSSILLKTGFKFASRSRSSWGRSLKVEEGVIDCKVTEAGDVHFMVKGRKKSVRSYGNYIYSIYKDERPIITKFNDIGELYSDIHFQETEGKLQVVAFYGDYEREEHKTSLGILSIGQGKSLSETVEESLLVKGLVKLQLDPTTHELSDVQKFEFNEELLGALLFQNVEEVEIVKKERSVKKDIEHNNDIIRNQIRKDKDVVFRERIRKVIVKGETINVVIEGWGIERNKNGDLIHSTDDIHFLRLSNEGVALVSSIYRKFQTSLLGGGNTTSAYFDVGLHNGHIYILYMDLTGLNYSVLTSNGELIKGGLYDFDYGDKWNNYVIIPRSMCAFSENDLVGLAYAMTKMKFYLFTLN